MKPTHSENERTCGSGITTVTRKSAALITPPGIPESERPRYGMAVPFQLTATTAGFFCNIRKTQVGTGGDYEFGTDVVVFDDLSKIASHTAILVSRNHQEFNPHAGEMSMIVKYPVIGAFVPLGAKRTDGTPHPHAGTGFGMSVGVSFSLQPGPYDSESRRLMNTPFTGKKQWTYFEVHQFRYDGREFQVSPAKQICYDDCLPGTRLAMQGLTPPIPDGDGFLYPMSTGVLDEDPVIKLGISRWVRNDGEWVVESFQPFTDGTERFCEMSLVRDIDGSLLYSARGADLTNNRDLHLWRSPDNGRTWEYFFRAMLVHSGAPVTLNQAADGTPYFAANLLEVLLISTTDHRRIPLSNYWRDRCGSRGRWLMMSGHRRKLYLWPLCSNRQDMEAPILARDGETDFGPEPTGNFWNIDHPIGLTVRLGDRQWHHMLTYRVLGGWETAQDAIVTPRTGCYVEEVLSKGPAKPVWCF